MGSVDRPLVARCDPLLFLCSAPHDSGVANLVVPIETLF